MSKENIEYIKYINPIQQAINTGKIKTAEQTKYEIISHINKFRNKADKK